MRRMTKAEYEAIHERSAQEPKDYSVYKEEVYYIVGILIDFIVHYTGILIALIQ